MRRNLEPIITGLCFVAICVVGFGLMFGWFGQV